VTTTTSANAEGHTGRDHEHRCNFSQIPHLLLDEIAQGRLKPTALVLYTHYVRVAWQREGQPIVESLRDTEKLTGLSQGTILAARRALADAGWIVIEESQRVTTVSLTDRWAENCSGHSGRNAQNLSKAARTHAQNLSDFAQNPGANAQNLSKVELEVRVKTEDLKDNRQQHAREEPQHPGVQPRLPRLQAQVLPLRPEDLVSAVYRGAGLDVRTLTEPMYARELAIASALIRVGAEPLEGEAWARQAAANTRRYALIDMRAFEHERAAFHREERPREGPRRIDRTGQPPPWALPLAVGAEA
jgi:hypothetical protein